MPRWRRLAASGALQAAGFQGQARLLGRWGMGSAEGSPMVLIRLDAGEAPPAGRVHGRRAAGLYAKWAFATHILRVALSPPERSSTPGRIKLEPSRGTF